MVTGRPPLPIEKTTTFTIKIPAGMKAALMKKANGPRTPATYLVDEVVCMTEERIPVLAVKGGARPFGGTPPLTFFCPHGIVTSGLIGLWARGRSRHG